MFESLERQSITLLWHPVIQCARMQLYMILHEIREPRDKIDLGTPNSSQWGRLRREASRETGLL